MGCISSKRRTTVETRTSSAMFKVTNIDYQGNEINHGQIEITDNELIMHYAGNKTNVSWPLCSVRRYGFEDFMFCFEAGRLSPYGQGIFAFRSKDADKIFRTIRERLQISNDTNLVKNLSSGMKSRSKKDTVEDIYDEVSFCGPKPRNKSIVEESPYLELNINNPDCATYQNIFKINEINDELVDNADNGTSSVSSKEEIIYTEVEIVECKTKIKRELPEKEEVSDYTVIDFVRTRNYNNRNLFKSTSNSGTRRTRHDYPTSSP